MTDQASRTVCVWRVVQEIARNKGRDYVRDYNVTWLQFIRPISLTALKPTD